MKITVLLCTYNRCQLLARALESVAASTLTESVEWEVLVVDNNSTDKTHDIVEKISQRYIGRFRYLFEPRQGKSNALNAGVAAAKGEVLAFMDDDVIVEVDWLQNLTAQLLDGKWTGSGGRVLPLWVCPTPNWLPSQVYVSGPLALFDQGDRPGVLVETPIGNNMAFRREVFHKYGGFRTDLGPRPGCEIRNEDSEFGRRLFAAGEQLYYEPSAVLYHLAPHKRLQREYFLAWWFDKARADIRELGPPTEARWFIRGVPLLLLRRISRWTLQWICSTNPARRFEYNLKTWLNAGLIVECYRLSRMRIPVSETQTVTLRRGISDVHE
jgi:glycosyltransferase involved in cell wall biosynthesis